MLNEKPSGIHILPNNAALPPPPGPLMITLSSGSSLTVSWSPPSDPVEGGVGGYVFSVTGEGCGCVSMNVSGDATSVICSGWIAADQTCYFEVRTLSQDCGFAGGLVNGTVTLKCKLILLMCMNYFNIYLLFYSTISS